MAASTASTGSADAALVAEEARLARAAADGDGGAFATLYERYERRAYNLAYRLTGSEDDAADAVQDAFLNVMRRLPSMRDRELAFGSYLFTATRNAGYDLMAKRKRAQPSDSIPESAAPVGAGAGGLGLDPGDPGEDPDRKLLLESQQEEIRAANALLPERQREALALRELEELSYDEIAEIMDMNRNSVAQLISRARIRLRDELRGTALASIAVSSPECERALPLIALRDDGQLEAGDGDAAWLDGHVGSCDTCRLSTEAMQEAGTSYRAWAPIAAAPWLFEETMAKAAELVGADWSEEIAAGKALRSGAVATSGKRRRRIVVAATLAAALLVGGVTTVLGEEDAAEPAPRQGSETVGQTTAEDPPEPREKPKQRKRPGKRAAAPTVEVGNGGEQSAIAPAGGGTDSAPQSGGDGPSQPEPNQPADQSPDPTPAPPPSDPPPVVDEPPIVEEPPPVVDPPPRDGGGSTGPPIL